MQHMKNTKTLASVLYTQVEADIAQMGTDVVPDDLHPAIKAKSHIAAAG